MWFITLVSDGVLGNGNKLHQQVESNESNWPFSFLRHFKMPLPPLACCDPILLDSAQFCWHCIKKSKPISPPTVSRPCRSQTSIHSIEQETIKTALMTQPLTFSLLCDKNRLFIAKPNCRIAIFPATNRTEERYPSLLILLKYIAVNAAIIQYYKDYTIGS